MSANNHVEAKLQSEHASLPDTHDPVCSNPNSLDKGANLRPCPSFPVELSYLHIACNEKYAFARSSSESQVVMMPELSFWGAPEEQGAHLA